MRFTRRTAGLALAAVTAAGGFALASPATAAPAGYHAGGVGRGHLRSCLTAVPGVASCQAILNADAAGAATASPDTGPAGLHPADLQSAYQLPSSTAGAGMTIAVVDAYNDPNAGPDLGVYRQTFGLPACTSATGCFRKVDENGGTTMPPPSGGWAQEISLDLDMVSAIAPNAKILLVLAKSASLADLGAAENTAARLGANVISNSYGGSDASDASYGAYYDHPGVAITVSSGDSGYGVQYPASSHYVTAVGGTTLKRAGNSRGWTETAWSGAGSGCSTYNAALSGQAGASTGCAGRAVADVSAVADPSTGVSVYDTYMYQGYSGWLTFGGTSAAAPIIAGVYALAGNAGAVDNNYPYAHAGSLFDVTSGANGTCGTARLCTAAAGWDGPTGLGTPNGVGAF
jgi:subtilase family serine protease